MRKKIVAGNWKMNLLPDEALSLYSEIASNSASMECKLILFPPALYISSLVKENRDVPVGVQNFYPASHGAYTGEISISQVRACGAKYALVGHSERRLFFHESNDFLKEKINAALSHDITPIVCCGESLEIRDAKAHIDFVTNQLKETIGHLKSDQLERCIIAYEPIWAIGTGRTASIDQAQEMHAAIRQWLINQFGDQLGSNISILYGGSCNATNASELFACPDVDGGLIGGASLDAASFLKIARAF
jgi:triosephosphate isomerase